MVEWTHDINFTGDRLPIAWYRYCNFDSEIIHSTSQEASGLSSEVQEMVSQQMQQDLDQILKKRFGGWTWRSETGVLIKTATS